MLFSNNMQTIPVKNITATIATTPTVISVGTFSTNPGSIKSIKNREKVQTSYY